MGGRFTAGSGGTRQNHSVEEEVSGLLHLLRGNEVSLGCDEI